ncbi:MAG: hypothetical protein HC923_03505 [Myxococcales bacterium]|nr:hypothetical protein [Myxococcales bacterium]
MGLPERDAERDIPGARERAVRGSSGRRPSLIKCDPNRAVQQAQVYRRAGQLGAARGELEMAKFTEAGYDDPVVRTWLAIVAFAQNDFSTAGRELSALGGLGKPMPEPPPDTIKRFLEYYARNMGSAVVEAGGTKGKLVAFRVEVDAPPISAEQGSLMTRFLEVNQNVLLVKTGERIHLPAGSYRFGKATVDIYPGGDAAPVGIETIGDPQELYAAGEGLPERPPFESVRPAQWNECVESRIMIEEGYAPKPWIDRNKWWLIGAGAAVAVGVGVGIAAAAASTTQYDIRFQTGTNSQ